MEEPPAHGVNKTTIILAVISGLQAIILALVGTGRVPLGPASAQTVAAAEKSAAADYLPLKIDVGGFNLKAATRVAQETCLHRSQAALEPLEFRPIASGEEEAIRMSRPPVSALIWCYEDGDHDEIVIATAGPSSGDPHAALELIDTTLRVAFSNEVEPEE